MMGWAEPLGRLVAGTVDGRARLRSRAPLLVSGIPLIALVHFDISHQSQLFSISGLFLARLLPEGIKAAMVILSQSK